MHRLGQYREYHSTRQVHQSPTASQTASMDPALDSITLRTGSINPVSWLRLSVIQPL
ncbi:hypothetical protein QJS10_CPA02g00958 [Acorus calamus]|uniref:Uncharacterized protein n=1 Tax=Acorus calamus TaxID=4465 RepID=A0AAV9FF22_ACOCL|nr:hypothetical protein QJS10_CPA02g00958 [Acorus calamus]